VPDAVSFFFLFLFSVTDGSYRVASVLNCIELRGWFMYRFGCLGQKLGKLVSGSFFDCSAWSLLGENKFGIS
jgi:hypothetical protein